MTVKELIEKLKDMPQDAQVEYPSGKNWFNYVIDSVESLVHNDYDDDKKEWVDTEFVLVS